MLKSTHKTAFIGALVNTYADLEDLLESWTCRIQPFLELVEVFSIRLELLQSLLQVCLRLVCPIHFLYIYIYIYNTYIFFLVSNLGLLHSLIKASRPPPAINFPYFLKFIVQFWLQQVKGHPLDVLQDLLETKNELSQKSWQLKTNFLTTPPPTSLLRSQEWRSRPKPNPQPNWADLTGGHRGRALHFLC